MQGNKKHTDGHSDSSSIGSLLDDTDREVCSLTDRAFKSLCVAELEASYPDADPAVSPSSPQGVSCKSYQGSQNHALQKNMAFGKRLSKTYEQSTFQQFPKDTQEEQKISINYTPNVRRKLGLPVSGLRNYKHTSKVSSLIKTFDKFENKESLALAKQPAKNSLTKFPLICGGDMALWDDKTILNIQKELSEFSDSYQDMANASGKFGIPTNNKIGLVCQVPHSFYPSHSDVSNTPKFNIFSVSKRVMKSRTGKGKEQGKKDSFLHSENSAFESWNLHTKKQVEMCGSTDFLPIEGAHKYKKETPFFKKSCVPEYKPPQQKVTTPIILEQDFSDAFPQKSLSQTKVSPLPLAKAHFPPTSIDKHIEAQVSLAQDFDPSASIYRISRSPMLTSKTFPSSLISHVVTSPAPISRAPIPLPLEYISHGAASQAPLSQDSELLEKTLKPESKPELENVHPPWRRQKTKGRMELAQDVVTEGSKIKDSLLREPSQAAANDSHISPSDPSSPSFNISELLTPVIPPKTERVSSESHTLLVTPPIAEAETKDSEEKTPYSFQNNYKSKASSLLFNLKDIRKRVKSTYSPSPLLKTFEDKKLKEQDSIKASITMADILVEKSKYFGTHDEAHHKSSEQMDSTQKKDRDTNITEHLASNDLTLKDHKMASVIEFSPNKQHISQHSLPSSSYLANVTTESEVHVHSFHLQDPKNEKVVWNHTADARSQISPNLFLSAEENIINYESQACPSTENEQNKKARSTSSSEQSFVSVIDPPFSESPYSLMQLFQKACLQESQRNKNEMNEEENLSNKEKEKTEKKKELHDSDEKDERKEEQSENESVGQETVMREKREVGLKSMDSAPTEKSDEPMTPTSPCSLKPNLFMIKDNTFKSSPVIKAVKLPLLRSLSCEDAISGGHIETEKQIYGPVQTTSNIQESGLFLLRSISQQNVKGSVTDRDVDGSVPVSASGKSQTAEKYCLAVENVLGEGLKSFETKELGGDNKEVNVTSVLPQKELKSREKPLEKDREKIIAEKLRCDYASGPDFDSEEGFAESTRMSDAKEETNYFKNHLLPKRRGGACMKKIISQEMNSPIVPETNSPAPSVVSQETSNSLARSSLLSSRPDSMMQSNLISPSSDPQGGKVVNSLSLLDVIGSGDGLPATEASDPTLPQSFSRDDGNSPVTNEKLQLMPKTAAKPPAVPPKTEKALRRAKKLANRRKKTELQQKRLQDELVSHNRDSASLSVGQAPLSPVSLNSPLMSSVSNRLRFHPTPPLSPTHSLPATRRKLLQDPDSGEYFIVDLPIHLKTFYDPESDRYVQISVPSSRRNVSQRPSSELLPSSYVLYPSTLPIRVSSVPTLASPSQLSEPASLTQGAVLESASGWPDSGQYPDSVDNLPYVGSAASDIHAQEPDHSHYNFETDVNLSDNADIISTGAIEDFAVEGIS